MTNVVTELMVCSFVCRFSNHESFSVLMVLFPKITEILIEKRFFSTQEREKNSLINLSRSSSDKLRGKELLQDAMECRNL